MKVCFIGHRKVENEIEVHRQLFCVVSKLMAQGADTFLFGSNSDFDYLCWKVVTVFQKRFPKIKRIKYNALYESGYTSPKDRESYELYMLMYMHKDVHCADYDEAINCEKYSDKNGGRYLARNKEMIDNSDVCVFYYNKDNPPSTRQGSVYQRKSGTATAFAYANKKRNRL